MGLLKWIMKQYWRVGTIRTLASLGLGMFVLGRQYYRYIPSLEPLGLLGALLLGTFLFLFFLGLGWAYDVKAKMWTQKMQATTERSVYQYVPNFKNLGYDYPVTYVVVATMRDALRKLNQSIKSLDSLILYLDGYFNYKTQKKDIFEAEGKWTEFRDKVKFSESLDPVPEKTPLSSKVKLSFETNMLRLNWIQSLTGLVQDVLIFGALYVLIVFPDTPPELELFLGLFGITLPLLLFLLAAGWYYDKKLRVWSADEAVKVERNPYSYVAEPYLIAMVIPFFYAYLVTCRDVLEKKGSSTEEIDRFIEYLREYTSLSVSKTEDLSGAIELRKSLGSLFENDDSRR